MTAMLHWSLDCARADLAGAVKLGNLDALSADLLGKANAKNVVLGHEVKLSVGDLFRHRRALRTVIGELRKLS